MRGNVTHALALTLVLTAAGPAAAVAQQAARGSESLRAAPAPFGVGELARYRVSYGIIGRVGTGSMHVVGVDNINGHPSYHMHYRLEGGIPGARVNNTFDSWMDVRGFFSRRFEQDTHEVRFRRERTRDFFPEQRRWTGHTNGNEESGELPSATPLDDTSFLYYVRTLKLEVGKQYEFSNYWNPDGNPVRIKVLRRETVRVPAGTFNTIVVQPLIQTSGMFSDGGEAEVYFSDDDRRVLVMLRAKVSFGTLRMELEQFTPGERLSSQPFVPMAVR